MKYLNAKIHCRGALSDATVAIYSIWSRAIGDVTGYTCTDTQLQKRKINSGQWRVDTTKVLENKQTNKRGIQVSVINIFMLRIYQKKPKKKQLMCITNLQKICNSADPLIFVEHFNIFQVVVWIACFQAYRKQFSVKTC